MQHHIFQTKASKKPCHNCFCLYNTNYTNSISYLWKLESTKNYTTFCSIIVSSTILIQCPIFQTKISKGLCYNWFCLCNTKFLLLPFGLESMLRNYATIGSISIALTIHNFFKLRTYSNFSTCPLCIVAKSSPPSFKLESTNNYATIGFFSIK